MTTGDYRIFGPDGMDQEEQQEVILPARETERLTVPGDGGAAEIGSLESLETSYPETSDAAIIPMNSGHRRTVFLFSLTTIMLFADQNLLSPNLTAIANEFGFSDDERDRKLGGDIALAFFLLGAPASFLVGCLADQLNRSILFACTVGIGEGACFATYFTFTYPQLYVCRAITGFSVGGALPLIYSVLGDLFQAHDRHAVSAIVGIGTGVGIAFGQGVAGFLGPTFGWRLPFLIVSMPALLCAVLVGFTVPDPERGGMERVVLDMRHHQDEIIDPDRENGTAPNPDSCIEMRSLNQSDGVYDSLQADVSQIVLGTVSQEFKRHIRKESSSRSTEFSQGARTVDGLPGPESDTSNVSCGQDWRSHFKTLRSLLSCPTVILTFLQGAPGCLPWGIVNSYLNDYLAKDRGMTVEGATTTVLCFGLGNFFGMVSGGGGGRFLYMLDPRYPALFAGFAAILGCIPFWLLLTTVTGSSHFLYIGVVTVTAGLLTGITGPIVKATLQNVTFPTTRGQAFAIYNLFDDFGRGLGPVFVSLLIIHMGGRTPAFTVGVLGWTVCGVVNLMIYFTVARDERKIQAVLAASLTRHETSDSSRYEYVGEPSVREETSESTSSMHLV